MRLLDVGEGSFLGIVEGFPDVLVHAGSTVQAEAIPVLADHLERLKRPEETRLELDDFPTVRTLRLRLGGWST